MPDDNVSAPPAVRLTGIDAFRFISFIFIVIIHSIPASPGGIVLNHISRFAVPFFFISSGYFLGRRDPPAIAGSLKLLYRLVPVFLFWLTFYVAVFGKFSKYLNLKSLMVLLIAGGDPAFHLWFLPALGISTVMLLFLRVGGLRMMILIAVLLYVAGLAMGPYAPVLDVPYFPVRTRNGPFFGFAFTLIGYVFARKNINPNIATGILFALSGLGLQLLEALGIAWLRDAPVNYYDFLLGTSLYGTGIFIIACNLNKGPVLAWLARLGQISLGMYCVHVFFVRIGQSYLNAKILLEDTLIILLAVLLSVLVAMIGSRIPYLRRVFC